MHWGLTARALGVSIFTEADSMAELKEAGIARGGDVTPPYSLRLGGFTAAG